jgi:hypothetical protein
MEEVPHHGPVHLLKRNQLSTVGITEENDRRLQQDDLGSPPRSHR